VGCRVPYLLHLAFWHVLKLGLDRDPFDCSYVIKPLEYQ